MWKDIPGYEGLYIINEYGCVVNINRYTIKTWDIFKTGYATVSLWKNNKMKHKLVHRLVAMAFILNPNNLPIVMHKDNNKLNNHISNLKWGTIAENTKQAYDDGLIIPPIISARIPYEIHNNENSYRVLGYQDQGAICVIGYGTMTTIHNAVSQNGKLRYGPYKGYQIRKAEKVKPFYVNSIKPFTINR